MIRRISKGHNADLLHSPYLPCQRPTPHVATAAVAQANPPSRDQTWNLQHLVWKGLWLPPDIWDVQLSNYNLMLLTETKILYKAYCHIRLF